MEKRDDGLQHVTWAELTDADKVPTTFNDERAGGNGHYVPEPLEGLKKGIKRNLNGVQ